MRIDLDHLPERKRRELDHVRSILFEEFGEAIKLGTSAERKGGQIQMMILYGSHTGTGWVEDRASGYLSDYDILIVVSHQKLTDIVAYWARAEERIARDAGIKTPVQIIVHTLAEVNDHLSRGQYFFTDIYAQGIELYRMPGKKLRAPTPLDATQALAAAQQHYDIWMPSAQQFLVNYEFNRDKGWNNLAVFALHQAVERAYAAYLLLHTNYRPHTHNIEFLRSQCERLESTLIPLWPRHYQRDRRKFQLLKRAYIEARYSPHFKITREELEWLGEHVSALLPAIDSLCKERLASLLKK
jgi:HEPN domain-containing protein/predicted nucleotidyltransferase